MTSTGPDWTRFPGHRVNFLISSERVHASLTCEAPEGANCRLECAENCGAEEWPCSSTDRDGVEHEHAMKDGGFCNVVEFVHAGFVDAAESYDGPDDHEARPGPVQAYWNGDGYLWRFPDGKAQ